jgi:hypothetical protein
MIAVPVDDYCAKWYFMHTYVEIYNKCRTDSLIVSDFLFISLLVPATSVAFLVSESEQRSCVWRPQHPSSVYSCKAAVKIEQSFQASNLKLSKGIEEKLYKLVEMDGGDKPPPIYYQWKDAAGHKPVVLDGLDMQPLQQIEPTASKVRLKRRPVAPFTTTVPVHGLWFGKSKWKLDASFVAQSIPWAKH